MEYFLFSLPSVPDKLRCMDNVLRCELMRGEEVRRVWRTSRPSQSSQPSSPAPQHHQSQPGYLTLSLVTLRPPGQSCRCQHKSQRSAYFLQLCDGWPGPQPGWWSGPDSGVSVANILPSLLPVIIRHYTTDQPSAISLLSHGNSQPVTQSVYILVR